MKVALWVLVAFASAAIAGCAAALDGSGAKRGTTNPPANGNSAPELFLKMMPVLASPRCANCHGLVNPFANPQPPKGSQLPSAGLSRLGTIQHGGDTQEYDPVHPVLSFEQCEACHDTGWKVPVKEIPGQG